MPCAKCKGKMERGDTDGEDSHGDDGGQDEDDCDDGDADGMRRNGKSSQFDFFWTLPMT